MDSDTIGGLRPTAVKNEIGARFATPAVDTVLTQPMARGTMRADEQLVGRRGVEARTCR